jgi:hypothetical protein
MSAAPTNASFETMCASVCPLSDNYESLLRKDPLLMNACMEKSIHDVDVGNLMKLMQMRLQS